MSLKILMDVHIPHVITGRLKAQGVDVLTSQEDGTDELPDSLLLDHCLGIQRALFTFDKGFLREAARRQREAIAFFCIFYAEQTPPDYRLYADWLATYGLLGDPAEFQGRLIFIP